MINICRFITTNNPICPKYAWSFAKLLIKNMCAALICTHLIKIKNKILKLHFVGCGRTFFFKRIFYFEKWECSVSQMFLIKLLHGYFPHLQKH